MHYQNTHTGERVTEAQLWERYREALDELGDVTIGGLQYAQSVAFERVDPIAFRVGFHDWVDTEGWEEDYWESRVEFDDWADTEEWEEDYWED